MGKERLVGTWKMLSCEYRDADGKPHYFRGKNAIGRIMYDDSGNVSAQISPPDRRPFAGGDQLDATPEEIIAAFRGYVAYFGTWDIDEKEGTVTHHVEASVYPNYIGTDQKRFFKLEGNRLELITVQKMLMEGKEYTGVLVWERIG